MYNFLETAVRNAKTVAVLGRNTPGEPPYKGVTSLIRGFSLYRVQPCAARNFLVVLFKAKKNVKNYGFLESRKVCKGQLPLRPIPPVAPHWLSRKIFKLLDSVHQPWNYSNKRLPFKQVPMFQRLLSFVETWYI